MAENKILLSDNDVDNRLKRALHLLGTEHAQTTEGNAAISAAREMLSVLSIALIKAGVERENGGAVSFWPNTKA